MIIEYPEITTPRDSQKRKTTALDRHHIVVAKLVLNKDESEEDFRHLLAARIAEFKPATQPEMRIVEGLTICHWRQRRIQKAIDALFAKLTPGEACPETIGKIDLLRRTDDRLTARYLRLCTRAAVMVRRLTSGARLAQRVEQEIARRKERRILYFQRFNAEQARESESASTDPIQ